MLHPKQFKVNEAWIAFQLNDAPIRVGADGDFNCLALMDAASCFLLSSVLVPAHEAEVSRIEAGRLLKDGQAHKQRLPKKLFVPNELAAENLMLESQGHGITVARIAEKQLSIFIREARELFKERFG